MSSNQNKNIIIKVIIGLIFILFISLAIFFVRNSSKRSKDLTSETFSEENTINTIAKEDSENQVEGVASQKDKLPENIYNIDECSEEFMNNYFEEVSNISEEDQENILIVTTLNKMENNYDAKKVIPSPNNQYILIFDSKEKKEVALKQLEHDSSIISVDENNVVTLDASKYNSWGIEKMGLDDSINVVNNLNLPEVRVAVVDSGCDINLINKYYHGKVAETYDVLTKSSEIISDANGHGTHVIGTIAEGTPNNVKIVPIKVKGEKTYTKDVIAGINYIVYYNKADVINMSFGGSRFVLSEYIAIESANKKNIICVCSAGNNGTTEAHYPSGYDNTISIGWIDSNLKLSPHSNYGDTTDFVAPGSKIKSTYPDNDGYATLNGTSMATPHAVCAIAILKSYNKDLNRSNVINLLKNYATKDLGLPGKDIYYGYGFICFDSNLLRDSNSTEGCEEFGVFKENASPVVNNTNISLQESINLKVGETFKLEPIIDSSNNNTPKVTWKSNDSKIASVSLDGSVSARKVGTTTITATLDNGKTATCNVIVEENSYDNTQVTPITEISTGTTSFEVDEKSITGIYNNIIVVPYGKEITFQVGDNETVSSENLNVAKIVGNKIQIVGTGNFIVTVKNGDIEEKKNFFAWNAYLKKGKYYTYTDSNRKEKSSKVRAKTFFSVSKTENSKAFKIDDCFIAKSDSSNTEKFIGKYIRSYYNKKKNKSSTSNWKYSFKSNLTEIAEISNVITNTIQSVSPTNNIQETQPTNGAVAQIGSTYYNSLKEAFDSVPNDGVETEVTLLSDVSLTEDLYIRDNKNVYLNLNKKTINSSAASIIRAWNGSTLTIVDGTLQGGKNDAIYVYKSNLNIKDCTISSTYDWGNMGVVSDKSNVVIYSGKITGRFSGIKTIDNSTLTVKSGTITGGTEKQDTGYGIFGEGNIIIEDGTITGKTWGIVLDNNSTICTINNGKITGGDVGILNRGTLSMTGGTITGNGESGSSAGLCNTEGNATITGGKIVSKHSWAIINVKNRGGTVSYKKVTLKGAYGKYKNQNW